MPSKIESLIAATLATLSPSTQAADSAPPPCLTQAQAQAKYPGAHLYWHTIKRCWDNIPVGRRLASRTPAAPRVERPPAIKEIEPISSGQVFYPDLMPGTPPDSSMLNAEPITHWPPLIDIDEQPVFSEWNARISGQFNDSDTLRDSDERRERPR